MHAAQYHEQQVLSADFYFEPGRILFDLRQRERLEGNEIGIILNRPAHLEPFTREFGPKLLVVIDQLCQRIDSRHRDGAIAVFHGASHDILQLIHGLVHSLDKGHLEVLRRQRHGILRRCLNPENHVQRRNKRENVREIRKNNQQGQNDQDDGQ